MKLDSLLTQQSILPCLDVHDKKNALKMLASHAAALTAIPEKEIYTVLIEREHIGCTGMGNGVCIPHGRFEKLIAPLAVFARLARPIEFGAADGKPVDLIFLLLTPASANTEHLKALAVLSRLLRDKRLREAIRGTEDAASIHKLLTSDRFGEDAT